MNGYQLRQANGLPAKRAFRLRVRTSVKQYQILQVVANLFPRPTNNTIPTKHVPTICGTPIRSLFQTKRALPTVSDFIRNRSNI